MYTRAPAGRLSAVAAVVVCLCGVLPCLATEETSSYLAALNSISAEELRQHVDFLADDALEGREAGAPGGEKAAVYLREQFEGLSLRGAGIDGAFEQPFGSNYRNVLGFLPGSDPELKNEVVIACAHYDHVGYGTKENSAGPIGRIHNGADDNASGTSALLELAEAFTKLPQPPKRSILFAFWDAEEKEMLGSRHWATHPTFPLKKVSAVLNLDMVGRLRDSLLTVYGSRTSHGFRRLVSRQNEQLGLKIDFSWELEDDADHHTFFTRGIPVLFLHTGLHDEFHSPRDDAHLMNGRGMNRVTRLAFHLVYELAQRDEAPDFRKVCTRETEKVRRQLAQRQVPVVIRRRSQREPLRPTIQLDGKPRRLGITWREDEAEPGTVVLTRVTAASPAAEAGLQPGDRVYQVDGRDFADNDGFRELVKTSSGPLPLLVEREGRLHAAVLHFQSEADTRVASF